MNATATVAFASLAPRDATSRVARSGDELALLARLERARDARDARYARDAARVAAALGPEIAAWCREGAAVYARWLASQEVAA
jgi:hypothetical protein